MNRQAHRSLSHLLSVAVLIGIIVTAILGRGDIVHAQDADKELGWFFSAEGSAIWTGGNSESSTFGLRAALYRAWERSDLRFKAGGTQTESSLKRRKAVGSSSSDFQVVEEKVTEKTAAYYFAQGRYDFQISKRFLVFGGVDWLRNTFSGIDSRFLVAAGAGNIWADNDAFRIGTDYGITYTFQEDVVDNPFLKNNFPGVRAGYDLWWKLTPSTEFASDFIVDWNLDDTDDVRVDFTNALPISISDELKFKPAYKILWRNAPSLTKVDLFAPDGTPTGTTVLVPLEEFDTVFTVALVLDF